MRDGKVVGSALIGQPFDDPKYFWSRPSATGPVAYNGARLVGLEPRAAERRARRRGARRASTALRAADPGNTAPVPVDLVTASGSGLDPHISPAAARYQVGARRARPRPAGSDGARRSSTSTRRGRQLGFLGEPVVNVLALNLALDDASRR